MYILDIQTLRRNRKPDEQQHGRLLPQQLFHPPLSPQTASIGFDSPSSPLNMSSPGHSGRPPLPISFVSSSSSSSPSTSGRAGSPQCSVPRDIRSSANQLTPASTSSPRANSFTSLHPSTAAESSVFQHSSSPSSPARLNVRL